MKDCEESPANPEPEQAETVSTIVNPIAHPQRYELCWPGKQEALQLLEEPPKGALRFIQEWSLEPYDAGNIFVEGENLRVLKLLQEKYQEQVKLIYIDPPYNKGKDFVFSDDFKQPLKVYLQRSGQIRERKDAHSVVGQTENSFLETAGRFHSEWLNMMLPRLVMARRFLRDDGVIFISIDDTEVHNLRLILNEVFGEDNFVNMLHVKRAAKNVNQQFKDLKRLNLGIEYVLVYRKGPGFSWVNPTKDSTEKRKRGYWTSFYNNANRPTMRYQLLGVNISQGQWKWSKERAAKAVANFQEFQIEHSFSGEKQELELLKEFWLATGCKKEFIKLKNGRPHYWVKPSDRQLRTTDWTDIYINDNSGKSKYGFDTAKSVKAMKAMISAATAGKEEIIMDFFAGSGTTGEAVLASNEEDGGNRSFICVQAPEKNLAPGQGKQAQKAETIADICRNRLVECAREYGTGLKVFRSDIK